MDGHPNIEFATRSLGIGRDHYLKREQVAELWGETKQVFLVIEGRALAEWTAYLRPPPGTVESYWYLWFSGDPGESIEIGSCSPGYSPMSAKRLFSHLCRWLVRGAFSLVCRTKIVYFGNPPTGTGYILASNHISHFDPPFLGVSIPAVCRLDGDGGVVP